MIPSCRRQVIDLPFMNPIRNGLKYVLLHFVELVIAVFLLSFDVRYFLFFLMSFQLYNGFQRTTQTQRLIQFNQFALELKVMLISEKLGITTEESLAHIERTWAKMPPGERENLDEAFEAIKGRSV